MRFPFDRLPLERLPLERLPFEVRRRPDPAAANAGGAELSVIELQHQLVAAEDHERRERAHGAAIVHDRWGPTSVMGADAPWSSTSAAEDGPNMLSSEERRYLRWIAARATGGGAALELGPWLGQSTRCLLEGLPNDRRLTTVDDFTWRSSWMDPYLAGTGLPVPENHASFQDLFERVNERVLGRLDIVRGRFNVYDGNADVPQFHWEGGPIELLVVDCGRTQDVNETWWGLLERDFVAGSTLIVMQDWRLHREVPFQWYNQTKLFTESKESRIRLIHEVSDGGLAAFLYEG